VVVNKNLDPAGNVIMLASSTLHVGFVRWIIMAYVIHVEDHVSLEVIVKLCLDMEKDRRSVDDEMLVTGPVRCLVSGESEEQ
jgi:hypothetical protein